MRKEIYAIFLAFLVVFVSASAFAQSSLKIVVVDTDKAFKESIWGKKSIEELEKEAQGWQKKGEDLDNAITKLEQDLSKQRAFLSNKEDEQKLLNEIENKRMEGRDLIQRGNASLSDKREELLGPILEEIKNLIKRLSMDEGYDLVLEKQLFVLYLNPELDITNRVIVMLDKYYKENISSKAKGNVSGKAKEDAKPAPVQSEKKGTEQ